MKLSRMGVLFICLMLLVSTNVFSQAFSQSNITFDNNGRWAYGPSYGVATISADIGDGTKEYVFMGNGGYLVMLDADVPGTPVEVAILPLFEPLRSIAVELVGSIIYVYVADDESGLRIISATFAAATYTLAEVGSYNTAGRALDVAISQFGALNDIYFPVDVNTGWLVGFYGTILNTVNGGTNWTAQTSGTNFNLNGVIFDDNNNGWACGNFGTILYTTNGGTNWYPQSSRTQENLLSIHFPSALIGYAVGSAGTIIKTSDGGNTWTAQTSGTTEHLRSVYFVSTTAGWTCGNNGTVLVTADGGTTWTAQTSTVTVNLRGIDFFDATNGWAVGDGGTIIATGDGGTTWAAQTSTTTNNLRSLFFSTVLAGWAVGDNGTILGTADGGTTWAAQTSGTTKHLNAVDWFTGNPDLWAVGDDETIRTTADGGATPWTGQTGLGKTYAFVADGAVTGGSDGHVVVLDVTTRTAPVKVGEDYKVGDATGIAYAANHVYVTYKDNTPLGGQPQPTSNRVGALDVSNPTSIRPAGNTVDTGFTLVGPLDIVIDYANNFLYVADETAFRSIVVTDLANPTFNTTGSGNITTGFTNARGLAYDVGNTNVYVADGSLHQVDVSTPGTPVDNVAGAAVTDGSPWNVALDLVNAYAYVVQGLTGFQNFDISGWAPPTAAFSDLATATPTAPTEGGQARDVVVSGNFAYIADWDDGIRKIDILSTSGTFQQQTAANIVQFSLDRAHGIDVWDDGGTTKICVASGSEGLQIFTDGLVLDNPNSRIPTGGRAWAVDVVGDYAYIADGTGNGDGAFRVIDLNTRAVVGNFTSFNLASTTGTHNAWDVKVVGTRAFVAVQQKGVWILNVANPTSPQYLDYIPLAGEVYRLDVDVMGEYAFVADALDGLRIVDVLTTSANYKTVYDYTRAGASARDVQVSGIYAYVAFGTAGLRVYNITDPTNASEIGHFDTGDDAYGVALQSHKIYVADDEDGLYMLQNTLSVPTYFTGVVNPTGRSIPVIIESITLAGDDTIQPGDEIGIYDGDLLVGSAVYTGAAVTQITVWLKYEDPFSSNPPLPGAVTGNNMIFRIWNKSTNTEVGGFPTYAVGSDGRFSETRLLTVVTQLTGWVLGHFAPVLPTGSYITVTIQDNIFLNDVSITAGTEIGVYDGATCVGAAEYNNGVVTIIVWVAATVNGTPMAGAEPTNNMGFRIWDGTTEYLARPTYDDGAPDKTFGNDVTVIKLEAYTSVTQTITVVRERLNLISFNIDPITTDEKNISSMLSTLDYLQVVQNDAGQYYLPGRTPVINQIGTVDLTRGYQIYYKANPPTPDPATQSIIKNGFRLTPGSLALTNTQFYMIGVPYQNPHFASDVFATLVNPTQHLVVLQDDEGKVWVPQYSINTIDDDNDADSSDDGLRPGKGYKLYVQNTVNFTYPAEAGLRVVTKPVLASGTVRKPFKASEYFDYQETGSPYIVVVKGSKSLLKEGDEIGLFADDVCVGGAVFQGEYPMAIPAWEGFELGDVRMAGFRRGQSIKIRIYSNIDGQVHDVPVEFKDQTSGTYGSGALSALVIGEFEVGKALPTKFGLGRNFPNPFNPETTIPYQIPEKSRVRLTIYNAVGQSIRNLVDLEREAGHYTVKWDGRDSSGTRVSSGIYFVEMRAGSHVQIQKMTLLQ